MYNIAYKVIRSLSIYGQMRIVKNAKQTLAED